MPRFPTGSPLMPMMPMMPSLNPLLANHLALAGNIRQTSPLFSPFPNLANPFLQNLPIPRNDETEKDNSAFPTVMIPGIGPCMMIPTALNEGIVYINICN